MNIAQLIKEQATKTPYHKAVIFPAGSDTQGRVLYSHYTYERLDRESDFLAHKLRDLGLRAGQRILLFVRPSLEFSLVTFALFKLGAVPVLIDPGMGRKNLLHSIRQVRPDVLIAVPIVHFARFLYPSIFRSIKIAITTGSYGLHLATPLKTLLPPKCWLGKRDFAISDFEPDDMAAILFTSGGTGSPKGVIYTHGIFTEQVRVLKELFCLNETDKDLPGFPLFSMMTMAMGVTSVIPDMDPTRPAKADPGKLVQAILDHGVTSLNGSPAIWERVGQYCQQKKLKLPTVKAVMMYGAPVSASLHTLFAPLLPNGTTFSPYGATECLPVSCIAGREVLAQTAQATQEGRGTCVGRPVSGMEVRIIKPSHEPIASTDDWTELGPFEVGEIVVRGKQATRAYYDNPKAIARTKVYAPDGSFWHRMGDLGYLDAGGRLWFCGRQAHKVESPSGPRYSVTCEAIFNQHPEVSRSALIGITKPEIAPMERPCIVIERKDKRTKLTAKQAKKFREELVDLAKKHAHTLDINTFYLHADFPVDPRHNIKINRQQLQEIYSYREESHL